MNIARRWVFPIIRIVIIAAIAAALVKLAFFADPATADGGPGASPTGEIVEPQVPVAIGTIRNDVVVAGQINSDAARPVRATLAGEVVDTFFKQGESVKKDAKIAEIRSEEIDDDGDEIVEYKTVKAGSSGVLSSFSALEGQVVAVGDILGQIAPRTFTASGSLAPEQLYRLLNQPTEAQVTVTGGPAPFTCTDLTISTPLAGADAGEDGEGDPSGGAGGGTTVSCKVPKEVTVFPGLTAELTLAGGIAENVLTLPVTSVLGSAGNGVVYLVGPDDIPVETPVTLGLQDGVSIEITGGLAEGDLVLEFVPGADAGVDEGVEGEIFSGLAG